jgi:hypothetical protein
MTVAGHKAESSLNIKPSVRKYTTQREIISKIDLTGFSLRHLGMVVTIVTIISLTPVIIAS